MSLGVCQENALAGLQTVRRVKAGPSKFPDRFLVRVPDMRHAGASVTVRAKGVEPTRFHALFTAEPKTDTTAVDPETKEKRPLPTIGTPWKSKETRHVLAPFAMGESNRPSPTGYHSRLWRAQPFCISFPTFIQRFPLDKVEKPLDEQSKPVGCAAEQHRVSRYTRPGTRWPDSCSAGTNEPAHPCARSGHSSTCHRSGSDKCSS
jgi:hypothetical protein